MKVHIYLSGINGFIGSSIKKYFIEQGLQPLEIKFNSVNSSWIGLDDFDESDVVIHAGAHSSRHSDESDSLILFGVNDIDIILPTLESASKNEMRKKSTPSGKTILQVD